jgi:peptidoglycan/xylan/chitin deacetylase (PgdA/CDA1 family)
MSDPQPGAATPGRPVRRWQALIFPMALLAMLAGWFALSAVSGSTPGAGVGSDGTPAPVTASGAPLPAVVSAFASIPPRAPDCSAGTVSLTFDDGPHPQVTPALLDLLRDWESTATFYVIGGLAAEHPELVRRAAEEGHAVGNHTWTHADLSTLPPEAVRDELARTSEVIAATTGRAPETWRPPYGIHDSAIEAEAEALDLRMELWSEGTDGFDWKGLSPRAIADRIVGNAEPGSIVLLHDIHQNTLDALPLLLEGLHAKGLCAR